MTALQTSEKREVARPLKVLAPLIQADVENGDQAGMKYYVNAGEKLNEAKDGHFDGDTAGFLRWAEKTTGKGRTQINTWMGVAAASSHKSFKSLADYRYKERGHQGASPTGRLSRSWTAPVDAVAERARKEAFRLIQDEALTRAQERDAERALAHRLIDIGWKVLAKELHPDKVGGSRDAMKRLNSVRDKLKHAI
jgi:hypothetical protein